MPRRDPTPEQIAERAAEIRAGWSQAQRARADGRPIDRDGHHPAGVELRMVRVMDIELRNRIYGRARRVPVSP